MKIIITSIAIIISLNLAIGAQDTLYIYKLGEVTNYRAVKDIDSVKFESSKDTLSLYDFESAIYKQAIANIDSIVFYRGEVAEEENDDTITLGNTKTWRMDMNAAGQCVYFDGPLYYSGVYEEPYWAWNVLEEELPYALLNGSVQTSFYNWSPSYEGNEWIMSAQDYGTITFNYNDSTVKTNIFGNTVSGTFLYDTTTMKLSLTNCIIPIDTARINEGQFDSIDLHNLRLFSLNDSSMQIGVKRSYEGGKESRWTMIYNFVVDDYDYGYPLKTSKEPVDTTFTSADLIGTWKYDSEVAQDWVGWELFEDKKKTIESHRLDHWDTRVSMVTTLVSWGQSNADSIFIANDAKEFVFNSDGTCVLAGVPNNYSVANGIISFTTPLSDEIALVLINLTGTTISVLNITNDANGDPYTYNGIWIGQKNGDEDESKAVHLLRQ